MTITQTIVLLMGDAQFAVSLKKRLGPIDLRVKTVHSIENALGLLDEGPVLAMLAEFALMGDKPEGLISAMRARNPEGLFYIVIEEGVRVTTEDPSGLLVDDYLQKPLNPGYVAKLLLASMAAGLTRSTALEVVDPVISRARPYFMFRSPVMREALRDLPKIASSERSVLITGETGTGKEIISHAIHVMSPRAGGPFIALNCGAIPEGLIEGELFGHEKGAFTGAQSMRKGKFEAADGGTLLLDEIGDMPLQLQMRLLRVLEEGRIYRIGSNEPREVNVRVIAATLRDLRRAVDEGLFREDLYYRLNVFHIKLPRLADRVEDIALLAVGFMERAFNEIGYRAPYPRLSLSTIELLERMPWRGNVRELRNVMTRVATLLPEGARVVLPMHVEPHLEGHGTVDADMDRAGRAKVAGAELDEGVFIPWGTTVEEAETLLIQDALRRHGGNRTRAAMELGIGLRTLRRRINE